MARLLYEVFDGSAVTEGMLQESSQLFNENYGVWNEQAAEMLGKFAHAVLGNHVRLNKGRLRTDYLSDDTTCSYVRVTVDGCLTGNAFACRWTYDNKTVCWITQLVVHQGYREKGLAKCLLNTIRNDEDDIYGIMSSHPAACMAAAKSFGSDLSTTRLEFMKSNAEEIMKASPIRYVREAKPRGSLFNPEDDSGLVSSVDTGFWIDHKEPLEALARARETIDWPLGELNDGHEFLLILEVRRRARSRPRPMPTPKDTPSPQASV